MTPKLEIEIENIDYHGKRYFVTMKTPDKFIKYTCFSLTFKRVIGMINEFLNQYIDGEVIFTNSDSRKEFVEPFGIKEIEDLKIKN